MQCIRRSQRRVTKRREELFRTPVDFSGQLDAVIDIFVESSEHVVLEPARGLPRQLPLANATSHG